MRAEWPVFILDPGQFRIAGDILDATLQCGQCVARPMQTDPQDPRTTTLRKQTQPLDEQLEMLTGPVSDRRECGLQSWKIALVDLA